MLRSKIATIVLATLSSFLAVAIITHPEEALQASIRGLDIWWTSVFPALLPFFIVAELLIHFGVVRFIGVLLEPFMRPLFRVPGIGGFVWAMAMASGNPAGPKICVDLRKKELLTRMEGERLVAFTSCANPLFIIGAVSVGFFHNPALGILLALAHYGANLFVGLVMRFYGKDKGKNEETLPFSLKNAFREMHEARIKQKQPFGKLLGDAVSSSVQTLLMVGGFIILFSVLNRLLTVTHITEYIAAVTGFLFTLLQLPATLGIPFISGLFEMTIGSQLVSEVNGPSLLQQALVVSFLLAFGGFSIQAQVASILAQSDLRFIPFFVARIIQGFFAAIITLFLWHPVYVERLSSKFESMPVWLMFSEQSYIIREDLFANIGPPLTIAALLLYIWLYVKRNFHRTNLS